MKRLLRIERANGNITVFPLYQKITCPHCGTKWNTRRKHLFCACPKCGEVIDREDNYKLVY